MTTIEVNADATYRRVLRRLIPFLMIAYILAFLDRSNIGFGKLQTSADLGFSDAVFGIGAGVFYLSYSAFEVPSNLLLAKIGARATFARIMIAWGLVSMAFALMTQPMHFYLLRLALGAAEAGFFPGVLLFLSYWIPASRRARATAYFMSAMAISGVIGGPLSAWIMTATDGAGGWHGWQWMFVLEGAPAVAMGIGTMLFLPDRPANARWLSEGEKALIAADLARESGAGAGAAGHGGVWQALRAPELPALVLLAMALIAGIGGISLWLPTILKQAGMTDLRTIGLASTVPYGVAIVAQQLVARSSDRRGERRLHAAACGLIAGLGWIALPFTATMPWVSLLLLTVVTAGSLGATGPFWSIPPAVFRRTGAAAGIALITTSGSIAAFFAPIVVGWASAETGSLAIGQFLYGGMFLAGVIALVLSGRSTGARGDAVSAGTATGVAP